MDDKSTSQTQRTSNAAWHSNTNLITVPATKGANLVTIEYPGIVVNEQKAIETLGGPKEISMVRHIL